MALPDLPALPAFVDLTALEDITDFENMDIGPDARMKRARPIAVTHEEKARKFARHVLLPGRHGTLAAKDEARIAKAAVAISNALAEKDLTATEEEAILANEVLKRDRQILDLKKRLDNAVNAEAVAENKVRELNKLLYEEQQARLEYMNENYASNGRIIELEEEVRRLTEELEAQAEAADIDDAADAADAQADEPHNFDMVTVDRNYVSYIKEQLRGLNELVNELQLDAARKGSFNPVAIEAMTQEELMACRLEISNALAQCDEGIRKHKEALEAKLKAEIEAASTTVKKLRSVSKDALHCGLCFESMRDKALALKCGHTCCEDCYMQMWTHRNTLTYIECPYCRIKVRETVRPTRLFLNFADTA